MANDRKHLAKTKGASRRGGRPGNKNTAKGPRVGRKDKAATSTIGSTPLPQPKPGATIRRPPGTGHHAKTGGKDFAPGTNSHDGTVFRRTGDQLPRGNMILYSKIVYHDNRERMFQRDQAIIDHGSDKNYLTLRESLMDRVHGTSTKHIETTRRREPTFVFTHPDGTETPALPKQVGAGATPAAASAEDQLILGLAPVRV